MKFRRRRPRVRALVLSAGFGQRLRPLTQQMPKPLLPVLGGTVAGRTLASLGRIECERAYLNLHYLSDMVEETFGSEQAGVEIEYSLEREILGTLGALGPIARALSDCEAALMINGDSLCDWPLEALLRQHLKKGALATLLVARRAAFPGNVAVGKDGRLLQLRHDRELKDEEVASRNLVFAGAQVLSPELLDRVAGRMTPGDIVGELYEPMLDAGEAIQVMTTNKPWHDLGTPWRYLQGVTSLAKRSRRVRGSWISEAATVASQVRLRGAAIEPLAHLESGSRIDTSLILPGARVEEGCSVRESIIAPGVVLPAGTGLDRRLVTPLSSGRDPGARDSVVGQLVYTPIAVPETPLT